MRFCFHPFKGRFVSIDSWKDPSWVDVKSIRVGIDGEEKESREAVFGKNLINIKEKTIPQLLMDEVGPLRDNTLSAANSVGFSPILCLSDSQYHFVVS